MFFIFKFDLGVKHHPYFSNKSHGPEKKNLFRKKIPVTMCIYVNTEY